MRSLLTRALCAVLALSFVVPPGTGLVWAQDGLEAPELQPTVLDLSGLDALDVDPTTGELKHSRVDLEVGEGPHAFRVVRTWSPYSGDEANLGLHWVSGLDMHLDLDQTGQRATLVDEDGYRHLFERDQDGRWTALRGRPARVTEYAEGYEVTGLGDDRSYRFDRQGYLTLRAGPRGLTVRYAYDGEQRLVRVTGPWGALELERDGTGFLSAIRLPGGRRVRYERDEAGNLLRVIKAPLYETYSYDGDGFLTGVADGRAMVAYDELDRVVRLGGDGVRELALAYSKGDAPERALQVRVTRGGAASQTVIVSADGRRIERIDAEGRRAVTILDERDRLARFEAADGRAFTQTYDALGRVLTRTGPQGTTRLEYESRVTDRPTRIVLPDGRATVFSYDLHGNLARVQMPGGASESFEYGPRGELVATTDARGATTRFSHDERGYVVGVEETGVGATKIHRGEDGAILRIKRPDGRVVTVDRDLAGRVSRIHDAQGALLEVSYDSRGKVNSYRNELGQRFRYEWNARGELDRVSDGTGLLAAFEYDGAGRMAGMTDALGNRTRIERPEAGTVVVSDPTRGVEVRKHDAGGRLIEERRGDSVVSYAYDEAGNLVRRTTPGGEETFQYDAVGRMVRMSGPEGGFELGYDAAGRLAKLHDLALDRTVKYGYTAAGDRAELELPWGAVRYEHDAQGRVVGVTLPDGGRIGISLLPDGRRREISYPNGVVTRFAYDRARLTEVETKREGAVIDRRRYGYDERGRVAWEEDAAGVRTELSHDDRGRLIGARTGDRQVRYEYDAAGNRVREVVTTAAGTTEVAHRTAAGNRLVQRGAAELGYTPTGELATRTEGGQTTRYSYDHDGHLVQVEGPDGQVVRYGYAPNGTRLWREDGAGKTRFLNDLADVVGEYGPDGALRTGFVHGPGNDDVLAAQHGNEWFFYHYDQVRSVTAMTGPGGRVAARYGYDAFGGERRAEGEAVAWNPYRYTSRELDRATGLYHYRARAYSPELGRFTSPDPLGPLGGLNLYAYVDNDPTLFNDPFGLKPWYERAWEGVTDTASTVGGWASSAGSAVWDGLSYAGRQTWAFGRGFGKGLYNAGKGIVNMVLHPIDTVNGIIYAIENWEETKEAIKAKWDEYVDAAYNDPEKFAEMTGALTAEVLVSVAGTKGLDKLAKASVVANAGRAVANTARVAGSPVTRGLSRAGTALGTTFPRTAGVFRRSGVLSRARNLELARRAAETGNIITRTGRRVSYFGRDLASGGRLLASEPGAFLLYSGRRMGRGAAGLVAGTGRGIWTATRRYSIPTVLVFEDQITDAIERTRTREQGLKLVRDEARSFLDDSGRMTAADAAARIERVGRAYQDYRNYLLKPVHEEDQALNRRLEALNRAVERGELPPETIDSRLEATFDEFGRRRLNLLADLYDRNRDADHSMFSPSPNRTVSFLDEVALYEEALKRTTDPAVRALLTARIEDVKALMEHEYQLFRSGEHDALISGIAGPPRVPENADPALLGEIEAGGAPLAPPTSDTAGLSESLDGLFDEGDNEQPLDSDDFFGAEDGRDR